MGRKVRNRRRDKKPTDLSRLITVMVDDHGGSCLSFAQLAELTSAQLSRLMNPGPNDPAPGVLVCLKLSRASGMEPWTILRMAGHHKIAITMREIVLNHHMREPGTGRGLVSAAELEIVKDLRVLQPNVREATAYLIRRAAEERGPVEPQGQSFALLGD